jgi:hypothetical protein
MGVAVERTAVATAYLFTGRLVAFAMSGRVRAAPAAILLTATLHIGREFT